MPPWRQLQRRRRGSMPLLHVQPLLLAVVALLPGANAVRGAALLRRFSQLPDREAYSLPACSCDCCHVTQRGPEEIHDVTGAYLKCEATEVDSDEAANQLSATKAVDGSVSVEPTTCPLKGDWQGRSCTLEGKPKTVLAVAEEGTDYNNFCFFECQPYTFALGDPCVPLDRQERRAMRAPDGGGKDAGLKPELGGGQGVELDGIPAMPRAMPGAPGQVARPEPTAKPLLPPAPLHRLKAAAPSAAGAAAPSAA